MGFKIDIAGALKGLVEAEIKMKAAVGVYADSAGKKLEAWAKNPPYHEKPGPKPTEEEIIMFKTLTKKGLLKNKKTKIDKNSSLGPVRYKWEDHTSQARNTIQGGHEWKGNKCLIFVAGNTNYFPYLELAHEKKYAVLYPAVKTLSPEILKGMEGLLNKK
jgi:hypothetical protein